MNKTYLYDFLSSKKRSILKDMDKKIDTRLNELYETEISLLNRNHNTTIKQTIANIIKEVDTLVDLAGEHGRFDLDYYVRTLNGRSQKGFVSLKSSLVIDDKLKSLRQERDDVSQTFKQLEGVVKSNTSKRAYHLLTELGFEIPPLNKMALPAIKVDVGKILNYDTSSK